MPGREASAVLWCLVSAAVSGACAHPGSDLHTNMYTYAHVPRRRLTYMLTYPGGGLHLDRRPCFPRRAAGTAYALGMWHVACARHVHGMCTACARHACARTGASPVSSSSSSLCRACPRQRTKARRHAVSIVWTACGLHAHCMCAAHAHAHAHVNMCMHMSTCHIYACTYMNAHI